MNTTGHRKAIVISPYWAGILASVIATGMLGLFSYAASAYGQMQVLKGDVSDLKSAKIESRLSRIEAKLDWMVEQQQQTRRR